LQISDHAQRATTCAIALDVYARKFKDSKAARAVNFGGTRIGVHTGLAVVGNFGGDTFFDYTAHGDTVNTAARLESANRHFATNICVSGATVEQCPDSSFRPIGTLVLKGKTESVDAFEPVSARQLKSKRVCGYLKAFELMQNGDSNAAAAFNDLARLYPQDALIAFHTERLAKNAVGSRILLAEK
jgi:adenylate cyclase